MATRRTSKIGARAVRVSRLIADGTPDYENPEGALCMLGGLSTLEYSWEVEDPEEIFERDAGGDPCVNFRGDPTVKFVSGTLTFCKDDDRLHEILGGELLTVLGEPAGYGVRPAEGCAPSVRPQVAVELWRPNINCDQLDPDEPYKRFVLTRAKFRPAAETIENALSTPAFDFEGFGNQNIAEGPFSDITVDEDLAGLALFQVGGETALPVCPDPFDYEPLPPAPT